MDDLEEFDRMRKQVEEDLPKLRFPPGVDIFHAILIPKVSLRNRYPEAPEPDEGPVVIEYRRINGEWKFYNYKY